MASTAPHYQPPASREDPFEAPSWYDAGPPQIFQFNLPFGIHLRSLYWQHIRPMSSRPFRQFSSLPHQNSQAGISRLVFKCIGRHLRRKSSHYISRFVFQPSRRRRDQTISGGHIRAFVSFPSKIADIYQQSFAFTFGIFPAAAQVNSRCPS
jgi:hypothetical protein